MTWKIQQQCELAGLNHVRLLGKALYGSLILCDLPITIKRFWYNLLWVITIFSKKKKSQNLLIGWVFYVCINKTTVLSHTYIHTKNNLESKSYNGFYILYVIYIIYSCFCHSANVHSALFISSLKYMSSTFLLVIKM